MKIRFLTLRCTLFDSINLFMISQKKHIECWSWTIELVVQKYVFSDPWCSFIWHAGSWFYSAVAFRSQIDIHIQKSTVMFTNDCFTLDRHNYDSYRFFFLLKTLWYGLFGLKCLSLMQVYFTTILVLTDWKNGRL